MSSSDLDGKARPSPMTIVDAEHPNLVNNSNALTHRHSLSVEIPTPTASNEDMPGERSWAGLPVDLLELITCRLNLVDRFHLALACRTWLSVARAAPRHSGLPLGSSPCFLSLSPDNKTCSLFNPLHREKYTISTPSLPPHAEVVSVKDGWLLVRAARGQNRYSSIFFFNPLTKATIVLPDTSFPNLYTFSVTSAPTSPHCLVFAFHALHDWASIFVCRRGDKEWSEINEDYDDDTDLFDRSVASPVFHRGSFYCLGRTGSLAVFDPVKREWVINVDKPGPCKVINTCYLYLVECDGELFRVWAKRNGDWVRICKLDPRNRWKEVDRLGDKQVFVGTLGCLCSRVREGMADGIYFGMTRGEEVLFYSCESRQVQPGGNFCGAKDHQFSSCWIEPKWVHPSPQQLQWTTM